MAIGNWVPLSEIRAKGIPKSTLRRWCETGKIKAKKIGKKWHVDIVDMLQRNGFDEIAEEILKDRCAQ